ncbi:MAG: hypothetical protein BMS9Abin13_341 [Patescibacteria group bacterium]|nr:MAG: hypothetical protein BMS9Abin13_341 [Patescibacteria group bacterium]
MNKIIIPLSIIVAAALIGGTVLFSGGNSASNEQLVAASNNLRKLELSVPGMFCAGCTASVEGYISSVPGVRRVQARLSPEKSATVVYDPDIISKESIVKNSIFDVYGVDIISDDQFTGSVLPTGSEDGVAIPQDIQNKSQEAVTLLGQRVAEGKDVSTAQSLFNQVNSNIEQGNFANANSLLDVVINSLQNL